MQPISRYLPFSSSITSLQALTYLLGVSLFSISFLVFLNSSVSFVVTDLIGQKHGVGNVVGTLGFADELVALVACPAWGLVSDRLGVRWVATIGYTLIGFALAIFVQARNVYPQLLLARIFFAVGASASATMVTAILPVLTDDTDDRNGFATRRKPTHISRHSTAFSVESELTITPERYTDNAPRDEDEDGDSTASKAPALAGFVGLFTGCGALVALSLFLPLPTRFGAIDKVTPGEAVTYSFYVVAVVALFVSVFVFLGLRGLKGEEGKGWRMLLGRRPRFAQFDALDEEDVDLSRKRKEMVPYLRLLKESFLLGFTDRKICLGYVGGFVARASSVAISLFIPVFVNTFFIDRGFCHGSPNDPSQELKEECKSAYVLSSILTGVSQLVALLCAPAFGYLSRRTGRVNWPIVVATVFGMVGYIVFPHLPSPEIKNVDGRGGSPFIFLVVALIGVSQIGAIVCSLGILGQGINQVDSPKTDRREALIAPGPSEDGNEDEDDSAEADPLMSTFAEDEPVTRMKLKGSISGVYSLFGGAAILLLTKLGGYLFDKLSTGAPFYMMAIFNAVLLGVSLCLDASQTYSRTKLS
uniref:Major facilitator superfamily (MFS) profile domain-containing protein n=1 Tax=Bionectria ochroleuca TaxID=29856 RepID=A0A8H7NB84_BIOOC